MLEKTCLVVIALAGVLVLLAAFRGAPLGIAPRGASSARAARQEPISRIDFYRGSSSEDYEVVCRVALPDCKTVVVKKRFTLAQLRVWTTPPSQNGHRRSVVRDD